MSIRSNISNRGRNRFFLLCALGVSGLASSPAPARPIEFSEPGSSNLTVKVSGLGIKPTDLPSVEDRVFKPHAYTPTRGLSSGVKPLTKQPGFGSRPNNRSPGMFDRDKTWLELTPQEMLQSMMERESFKLPAYGAGNKSWDASDPYNLSSARRNGSSKAESRGPARETNRFDGASALNVNDPLAAFASRRSPAAYPATPDLNGGRPRDMADWLRSGEAASPDGRRDRMEPAGRLEEFRRSPAFQTPGGNPNWSSPAATAGRGNAFVTDVEKSSLAPGGGSGTASFLAPTAPVAPTAPLAPGQTSLTPAQYSPPAKAKPGNISAPRRSF